MTKSTGRSSTGACICRETQPTTLLSKRKRNSCAKKEQFQPGVSIPTYTEKLASMDSDTSVSSKLAKTAPALTIWLLVASNSTAESFAEDGLEKPQQYIENRIKKFSKNDKNDEKKSIFHV